MSVDGFSNAYSSTLSGAMDNSQLTLSVTSATGAPSTVPFRLRIRAEGANTNEIVTVTSVSGTTYTITRASESYAGVQTASAHASGATIEHVLTAGALATLATATAFIGARAYAASTQSIPNTTWTSLLFDTEEYDSDGFHSTSSNTSRFTVPAGFGGKYFFTATTAWAANSTGSRYVAWAKNGTRNLHLQQIAQNVTGFDRAVNDTMLLIPGDYIEVMVYQDSGGAINQVASVSASLTKLDSGKVGTSIGASAIRTTNQTISNSTATALSFDAELFDTDGFHDNSTNPTRMTIPAGLGGKYLLWSEAEWTGNTTGERLSYFQKNGVATAFGLVRETPGNTSDHDISMSYIMDLSAGDYVEAIYQQSSGGNLAIQTRSSAGPAFIIMRLDSGSSALDVAVYDYTTDTAQLSLSVATDLLSRTVTLSAGTYAYTASYSTNSNTGFGTVTVEKDSVAMVGGNNGWARYQSATQSDNRYTMFGIFTSDGSSHVYRIRYTPDSGTLQFGVTSDSRFERRLLIYRIGR